MRGQRILTFAMALALMTPGISLADTDETKTYQHAYCEPDPHLLLPPEVCTASASWDSATDEVDLTLRIDTGREGVLPSAGAYMSGTVSITRSLPDPESGVDNRYVVTLDLSKWRSQSSSMAGTSASTWTSGEVVLMGSNSSYPKILLDRSPTFYSDGVKTFYLNDHGATRNPPPGETRWVEMTLHGAGYVFGQAFGTPGVGVPVGLPCRQPLPMYFCGGTYVPPSGVSASQGRASVEIRGTIVSATRAP